MYDIGTVWVMDATHTPYGCSVWPALFTRTSSNKSFKIIQLTLLQTVRTGQLVVKLIFSRVSMKGQEINMPFMSNLNRMSLPPLFSNAWETPR